MKTITYCIALVLWALAISFGLAQEVNQNQNKELQILRASKEQVISEEKEALRKEVEAINSRLSKNEITADEADKLKQEAAERHALNIENKNAIIDNKTALIERNGSDIESYDLDGLIIRIGSSDDAYNGGIYIGPKDKKPKFDRRTTSDLVFAFGLNNVVTEGESIDDSQYQIGGSRFAELGWAWKTRVFKNSNWLRFKYGFSFQYNGLKPIDNKYLVDTGDQTELQTFPVNLNKAKFRMDNLVIPIHFEIGPSKKREYEDYFRYNTADQVKIGLGGYAGFMLTSRQKLKYSNNGEDIKEKIKADYNTNNFVYGLSGYIGWHCAALYVKYDLNTIFKDNPVESRNISLGLRFDMD